MRRGNLQQCVAVGRRARHRLQREIAAAARSVVDDDRLAQPLREPLTDQPRNDVGRAAGADEHDHGHRPCRPSLREGRARQRRQRAGAGSHAEKVSAGKYHADPPESVE
jgi:hypothetical protein